MERLTVVSACIVILMFASCTAGISIHDNETMKDMVVNGATPIEARCAVKGESSRNSICLALMNGR